MVLSSVDSPDSAPTGYAHHEVNYVGGGRKYAERKKGEIEECMHACLIFFFASLRLSGSSANASAEGTG